MSHPIDMTELAARIQSGEASIDEVADFVSELMPDAVNQVNLTFSPRQLIKQDRQAEPLPTDKRQLSSYRTRLGTMLEYALSTYLDAAIEKVFGSNLRLTFAVAHEYPDFYVRNAALTRRVRIEMKAVDADSDEQAARFSILSSLIQGEKDVVLLVGWEWHEGQLSDGTAYEHPEIFSYVVVPSADLASERDQSVVLLGGQVEADRIMVPKKGGRGQLTEDKGNAGKVLRLVHQSRKAEPFDLSAHIQRYLQFVTTVSGRVKAPPRPAKQRKPGKGNSDDV